MATGSTQLLTVDEFTRFSLEAASGRSLEQGTRQPKQQKVTAHSPLPPLAPVEQGFCVSLAGEQRGVHANLLCWHRKDLLLIRPGCFPDNSFAIHSVLSQWKDLEPEMGTKEAN